MNYQFQFIKYANIAIFCILLTGCISPDKGRSLNDPNVSGEEIARQACSNCHGLTGQSTSQQFPKLAGQQQEYLKAQLTDFKGHARKDLNGTQYMWGITNLTTSQVDELAAYFSSQSPMKSSNVQKLEINQIGESIFKNGIPSQGVLACSNCHGQDANGAGEIPRLSGQHSSYLYKQIMIFKFTDDRPRGQAMKQIIHNMNDEQANAVSVYLSTVNQNN
jgi:cytochrome c553